jgi:hypothetical protein
MSPSRTILLALALLAAGCAGTERAARGSDLHPPATESRVGAREPGAGPAPGLPRLAQARRIPREDAAARAVAAARRLLWQREIVVGGVSYGDGCAALVHAAFAEAGRPLPAGNDAAALHALARERGAARRGRPAPGDVVLLSDRPGGPAEHVGLVESVSPDGTALVLHRTGLGVLRVRVNGVSPWKLRTDSGRALNDLLVVGGGRVPAGRLLVAYATLL